jgi:hypothetical protein
MTDTRLLAGTTEAGNGGRALYFDFGTFWPSVRDFFNSTFFTAIAGSFAGAVGGAYAAQRIVARNKERDELLTEIRNTSAATVVAFDVCNLFVTIKQQHVKPLKDTFDGQKAELHRFRTKRHLGQIPPDTAFPFTADLRSLFLTPFPVDTLQKLVFERLSLDERRPLMLISAIGETVHGLNTSVDNRNRLVAAYKATHFADNELLYLYFGLPHGATRIINEEYPSLIYAIYRHTDDGIFFSKLLCEDLFKHNVELVNRFKKEFKTSAPTIIDRPDFTKPLKADLMPNDADYADWFTLFEKRGQTPGRQNSTSQRVKSAFRWVTELVAKKFHR